jgi:hypothetical protein
MPMLSPVDGVREPKGNAVDDGGAAVRPHDQQSAFPGKLLQRDFLFQRHVVREEHDVQAVLERAHRFLAGEAAGNRNQCQVGAGQDLSAPAKLTG